MILPLTVLAAAGLRSTGSRSAWTAASGPEQTGPSKAEDDRGVAATQSAINTFSLSGPKTRPIRPVGFQSEISGTRARRPSLRYSRTAPMVVDKTLAVDGNKMRYSSSSTARKSRMRRT